MAKVTIAGNAVVVTSSVKLEELYTIMKYRPAALTLMGGKGNDEEIFTIDVGVDDCGDLNLYGAYFCNETHDEAKLACITMCLDGVDGDIREFVADQLGGALMNLGKLEQTLPGVLESIKAERQAIMANITVAQ